MGFWDFDLVNLKGSFTKALPRYSAYRTVPSQDRSVMRNGWRRFTRKIALKRTRQRLLRDVTRHQLQKEAIAEGEELWRRMPVGQKITLLLLLAASSEHRSMRLSGIANRREFQFPESMGVCPARHSGISSCLFRRSKRQSSARNPHQPFGRVVSDRLLGRLGMV